MSGKKILLACIILFGAALFLAAQQPSAVLEYFEDISGDLRVVTADGEELYGSELAFGDELLPGSTLVTYDGDYAEISLDPNGSIIRISENTNFRVDALQGREGAGENAFSMAVGKFRAVVAKSVDARYRFQGQSAVCGVRGTDFGMFVLPGERESTFVVDGLVDFTNSAGQTVEVGAGMMADALAEVFQPVAMSAEVMADYLSGLEFVKLQKSSVPGYAAAPAGAPAEAPAEAGEGFLAKLLQLLGLEIGSVTIGDKTYAKAIVQPRFALGKLRVALYLPVIYQTNMLDPNDWHKPDGNNEWSFGTDQAAWDEITLDILNDLWLKIRYIEYGKQRDPFFFKFGNLHDITIGHGMIMRKYANDSDFPAVRMIGLNLGLDSENIGVEAMVNNAALPEIFGTRFYFRPMGASFPLAFGITALTDLNPDKDALYGRPALFNFGFDLDFPIIHGDPLSIIMFADLAAMLPIYRQAYGTITPGLKTEAILSGGRLKNWGFATGFMGNILPVAYRLEFQYSDGTFRPAFYNNMYDRKRSEYAREIADFLLNPNDPVYNPQTMGIYGEAGYTLENVFFVEAGYLWPWYINNTGPPGEMPDDYLHFEVGILKGLLPLYGSISYDRTRFVPTLLGEGSLSFFDENTVLSAEVVYPVAPVLDLAVIVANNVVGNVSRITVSILTRANY